MAQCRYYNKPGGCRAGANCKFAHAQSTSSNAGPSRNPQQTASGPVPSGVCRDFWATGSCRRAFDCRFRHVESAQRRKSQPPAPAAQAVDSIAPFLTSSGLARITGSGTDVFSNPTENLSPNETHNHLKRFLYDDYRFRKTFDIYAFVIPLNSAHSSNASWTSEDGQLLLNTLAAGNGLLRLNDIFLWPVVKTNAGSSISILSFQRAYLPLLRFLSSDFVIKSTLSHLTNALYMRILENFELFSTHLEDCMDAMMTARSFKDPNLPGASFKEPLGSQILASLTTLFFESLTRFKNATATYPRLIIIVRRLHEWMQIWEDGISSDNPVFDSVFKDKAAAREHIVTHLKGKMGRLVSIVDREQAKLNRNLNQVDASIPANRELADEGTVAALRITYDGPGALRSQGPRHDNDFVDIEDIRIAPTHQELVSRIAPFLPANLYSAPHPLPPESMERLLDIQVRLLREELTAPLRTSIQLVRDDLLNHSKKTQLAELIAKHGGKYRSFADAQDSIMFNVYSNVKFFSLTPDRRGLSVTISFDAPPGRARSSQSRARVAFWEGMSGKRLMQGGLIALVWKKGAHVTVHLGILASSLKELTASAKQNADSVSARIVFFDPDVELRILDTIRHPAGERQLDSRVLVEAPVMFEAIRPFLEALRVEPESLPFKEYLVHRPYNYFRTCTIAPPKYARVPGFSYQLASLFPPEAGVADLKMVVSDPTSVAAARLALQRSRLDLSQADAVVDALCREVALIQGPPGTGKSYTGVEILRVLLQHAQPILMIAFTNHALDHLLTSILDAGITDKIVRLGSRSADERISKFSIETLEMVAGQSRLDRSFGHHHRELKLVEEQIKKLMNNFTQTAISSEKIMEYIAIQSPEHFEHISYPPSWISAVRETWQDGDGWTQADRRGRNTVEDNSSYTYWLRGRDIDFLKASRASQEVRKAKSQPVGESKSQTVPAQNQFAALQVEHSQEKSVSDDESDADDDDDSELDAWERMGSWIDNASTASLEMSRHSPEIPKLSVKVSQIEEHDTPAEDIHELAVEQELHTSDFADLMRLFLDHGHAIVPPPPSSDRALDILLCEGAAWSMSLQERERLHAYWTQWLRDDLYRNHVKDFEDLRKRHAETLKTYNEGKDEIRRQLLRNIDIVGCTTTGAATLTSLLKGLEPHIMLVEEAGQVLEAHILGSLVPSVEHLILIGDPLQLRPTLNNYSLSMDSPRGSKLYKFDMSLMERLSSSDFPMSQIDVQRRMRPTISNLIRKTLYPRLVDHDLVKLYPDVRGFSCNVFFFDHKHKENGGASDDLASKYNIFEVDMIKDLVLYLLRQGCYSQEGDIVVLCAYLGQLARVRDALSDTVAVVIDERDMEALAEREEEYVLDAETHVEHVKVSKRVRLRTVDNYQGEEAKIVILSLVRNSGSLEDELKGRAGGIGFLRSENRTNVALSRAKEGLFILGNSTQLLSKSRMWRGVIEQLQESGNIGDGFPVACHRHPESAMRISKPGELSQLAPDGGCLRQCDSRLNCGHVCPYKCHPDDPNHITVTCSQVCRKLCVRGHPCTRECSQQCGPCMFSSPDIELPCGHACPLVPCFLLDNLEQVTCNVMVEKTLPNCEHIVPLKCSEDPVNYICTARCNGIMSCCGRNCGSSCYGCRTLPGNASVEGERTQRRNHTQHPCDKLLYCGHRCPKACSQDHECVTKCTEPCRQECIHAQCRQNCSTPCSPCQEKCTWKCQHYICPLPCGSICARLPCDVRCEKTLKCGHRCPSVCGEDCAIQTCPVCNPSETVVDMIMGRTLKDIIPSNDSLDELLITLPKCRHVFTVETLDGVCAMTDFYTQNPLTGRWLSLKAPKQVSQERRPPPTCPTCRSAITSPRYGRVFKSADLDILERNVISRMAQQLNTIQTSMEGIYDGSFDDTLSTSVGKLEIVSEPYHKKVWKVCQSARKAAVAETRNTPLKPSMISPKNRDLFLISQTVAESWERLVQPLEQLYKKANTVANMRSSHIHAWEAAFSFLYGEEMDLAMQEPAVAPRRPREYAMRMTKSKVGQPQPRADKRFMVEAIWITIQIRFRLAELAQLWLKKAVARGNAYPSQERQMWAFYGTFLLESCISDAKIAFKIAYDSESRRQMTRSRLLMLRAQLERFRLNVEIARQSGNLATDRDKLLDTANTCREATRKEILETEQEHCLTLPKDRNDWLRSTFLDPANTLVEEWERLATSIRTDTFYQPVSLDDMTSIVKALNFSHTGHFYNCPNGHTYVIANCGGAAERSNCPECGATIGGSDHNLDAQNTRAMEFENIAREQGTGRSPWSWGV
ncbi:hypothetical protein BDQ12DRAFT_672980 [Crucibulum laeve]|uniref:P-loop containing nucleoside triphosphate hydrolase protein n=1 Tax=Crucibulum laeve TaxID=68775 RepID=A0A5C3MG86_9AGAR|nr:hypothetical protein BDQ12DRAFT_672980 [Crucibulum laeve]